MPDALPIEGHASLFWTRDLNDDVTAAGAFAASLAETSAAGVKMLHQHDDAEPIGVWGEIVEDARGLFVRGRILRTTPRPLSRRPIAARRPGPSAPGLAPRAPAWRRAS